MFFSSYLISPLHSIYYANYNFVVQASLCNPPLEEGDQVLYICGKSVAEKTHDEIIGMIRASREEDPR